MSRKKNAFTNQTQKKQVVQNIGREITFTLTLTASRVNPYIPAIETRCNAQNTFKYPDSLLIQMLVAFMFTL